MGTTFILILFLSFVFQCNGVVGESYMLDPNVQNMQFPAPIVKPDSRPSRPPVHSQFRAPSKSSMVQPRLHTDSGVTQPPPASMENEKSRDANYNISEFLEAFNGLSDQQDEQPEERSTSRDYEYPPYGYRPPPHSYAPPPNYGSYAPVYQEPAYGPPPPVPHPSFSLLQPVHHSASKISLLKPALDLVKPVTTKVASKVSGLIGLVLALLTGSGSDDLELKGFKDIVVNGIIKPLLLAKGGIKTLISKLAIPVISLLLINLEVLITVWWLWEDCPEPVTPPPYSYPRPHYSYNYNTY